MRRLEVAGGQAVDWALGGVAFDPSFVLSAKKRVSG